MCELWPIALLYFRAIAVSICLSKNVGIKWMVFFVVVFFFWRALFVLNCSLIKNLLKLSKIRIFHCTYYITNIYPTTPRARKIFAGVTQNLVLDLVLDNYYTTYSSKTKNAVKVHRYTTFKCWIPMKCMWKCMLP